MQMAWSPSQGQSYHMAWSPGVTVKHGALGYAASRATMYSIPFTIFLVMLLNLTFLCIYIYVYILCICAECAPVSQAEAS